MSHLTSRNPSLAIAGSLIFLCIPSLGSAQTQDAPPLTITTKAADKAAVAEAANAFRHAKPSTTPHETGERREALTHRSSSKAWKEGEWDHQGGEVRYEGELTYQGGPVVDFAQSHPIYLLPGGTCPISVCWGDPAGFLKNLAYSQFIHLADQYIGLGASGRYTLGVSLKGSYKPPAVPLTDADVEAFVHAAALATGLTGYGHIYHVFLPPGQDECFDSTYSVCYSPDNPSTFYFCAYHGSVDFTDVGHVLYSVEPFQNVPGCQVRPGTPNGQLVDSTNNVLAHELFETITDPDISAWLNSTLNALYGEEIGDECSFITFTTTNAYFDPFVFEMNGRPYATQPMYSNQLRGCAVH